MAVIINWNVITLICEGCFWKTYVFDTSFCTHYKRNLLTKKSNAARYGDSSVEISGEKKKKKPGEIVR